MSHSRLGATMLLAVATAACGGAQRGVVAGAVAPVKPDSVAPRATVDSLGAAVARVARDSAADQAALDSLHRARPPKADSIAAPTAALPVRGEEVEREAVRLFGEEGRAAAEHPRGRAFWALYPLEATSKSSLFIQAERIPDTVLSQLLAERLA